MEESEKRRERLRAIRMEASQAGVISEVGSEGHQLSNPFTESTITPMLTNSCGTSRFDYYTDPMAAFSNDKRMSKGSFHDLVGSFNRFPTPRNPEMTPSPAHQVWPSYQPRSPYYNSGSMHPEMTPSPAHHVQTAYSPDPRMFRPQSTYPSSTHYVQPPYSPNPRMYQQLREPYYNSGPRNPSISPSLSPSHQGRSGRFHARDPYHSSYADIHNPSFRGTPSLDPGQDIRPWLANSHAAGLGYGSSPNSGRGRSGLGRGGNRGFGSHGSVSAELKPDLYYNKSMVEDPWKNLEPSIWKIEIISMKNFKTPNSRNLLHSDFFGAKKARISEASKESSSQPSLAEYLAAAFYENVGEEGNNGKSMP